MARIGRLSFLAAASAVLAAACGGTQGSAAPAATTPKAPPPPELVGVWRFVTVSPSGYTDPVTGKYWSAYGDSISFTFKPDGQLVNAHLATSALYGCHVSIFTVFEGTLVVQAGAMDVYFTRNTEHGEANCPPKAYDKALPDETDHWRWSILQQPPDQPQLVLTDVATNREIGRFEFQPGGQ